MSEPLLERLSPRQPQLGDHSHVVQFYETDDFLVEAIASFVREGLEARQPAVLIVTAAHGAAVIAALRARGLNPAQAIEQGMLLVQDAEETLELFMVHGRPDREKFANSVGNVLVAAAGRGAGNPVRAFGEMVDVLWRTGRRDAALELEELWNDFQSLGACDFSLLCAYVIDSFYKEGGIHEVCASHSQVRRPEMSSVPPRSVPPVTTDAVRSLIAEIAQRTELECALRASVNQLRAAEEEARRSKEDLEDFISNAVVAIHRVDANGVIRWANAAELDLLGYRPEEYIGHHIAEFHVDKPVISDMLVRLRRGDTLHDIEARVRTKSGEIRTLQISSNVQRANGDFVTTRCFSRDITEQKAIERHNAVLHRITLALSRALGADEAAAAVVQELRAVVGATTGSVLLLEPNTSQIERVFLDGNCSENSSKALKHARLTDAIPLCEAARTGKLVWAVGKDEIDRRYPDVASVRAEDGVETWGSIPLRFEGRVLGAIGLRCPVERVLSREEQQLLLAVGEQCGQALERARLHDVTLRARAEAEQANRAKDEFLAILGHELRNPLSPILTAVQLMRLRGEVTSTREQNIIERQVQHLTRLVDDLLDIARVARGKVQLDKRTTSFASVIRRALEIVAPLCEERRHHVEAHIPESEIWVDADETRLCQVLTNVLSNAAKYTPPGGRIELRVKLAAARVAVHVKDNGLGIPPALLPRIFDLFVQGGRSADRQPSGLGIGLSLVQSLVRLHGGSVAAHSAGPGHGSEFVIELPTIKIAGEERKPVEGEGSGLRTYLQVTPRRILVVDDNEDAGVLLGEMLRTVGHEVVVTTDAPRALEAIKHFVPEVGILDIGLPVIDGYELSATLREKLGPDLRLMAVTGYGQPQDRDRVLRSGFQCHFVKPISIQKVLSAIEIQDAPTRP